MIGLSLHEGVQQIPGFPGQSSVHPTLQLWYQQWAEEVSKVRALLSIPGEERVFGQAKIPIPKYLKYSKNPQTIGLISDLGKRMWRKQLETFFRPRNCKWGAQSTHPVHVFLWWDVCFLTCEQIRVRTGMWGATKIPQIQWNTVDWWSSW